MIDLFQNENYSLKNNAVNIINGIWFNPKRTKENNETYFGLELADLVSYPIFKYCRSMKQDKAYESIKEKIYNYHHNGYGLKLFP